MLVVPHLPRGLRTEVALRLQPGQRTLGFVGGRHVLARRALVAGALAIAVVAASFPALAGEAPVVDASARSVIAGGTCRDGPGHWRLSLRKQSGRILLVRLLVRGGRPGQRWNIFMDDNGRGFFAGSRVSRDGGVFAVGRRIANRPGIDHIHFAAHNVVNGNQCRGHAAI
jgi:hypothetical protein